MLSVLIETRNDEVGLARTLATLVGAAVEGTVREVIVCDLGSDDQTQRVADHAGCHYLREGGVGAGIARAKSEWLLLIEPGARMVDGWDESVRAHLEEGTRAGRFTQARVGRGRFLTRLFSARRPLRDGLVVTRRQAQALARPGMAASALARGVSAHRLEGEIVPAPGRN